MGRITNYTLRNIRYRIVQNRHPSNSNMLALAVLVIQFFGVIALEYSDLEAMGVACKGRDSCRNMTDSKDFFKRNCECDFSCSDYGDCCFDAPSAKPYTFGVQECMPFGTAPYQGAYVVSSCPDRGGSSALACMENDMYDPLLTAPVSTPEGETYRNAHCAECNGADLANLVTWLPLINCQTLAPYNLSADFVWSGLERSADEDDEWGVWFEKQFHTCEVLFDKPDSVNNLRFCRAPVVSSCPDNYRRKSVRRQCEAYTAVVYTAPAAYLNPHCAICNRVPVDKLVCDYYDLLSRSHHKFSMKDIFDVGSRKSDYTWDRCPRDQRYDPFSKKCRKLGCGLPGYRLVNMKCVRS